MLIDSSEYITIRRKNRFYGILWKSGDVMSTFGTAVAILAPLIMSLDLTIQLMSGSIHTPFKSIIPIIAITVLFSLIAFLGKKMKAIAKRLTIERG